MSPAQITSSVELLVLPPTLNILQDSHLKKLPLDELAHLRPSHLLKGLEIKRSPSIYALYINIFFPLLFLHLLSLSIIFLTTKYLSDTILSIHQQEPNQSWIEPTALHSIYIHLCVLVSSLICIGILLLLLGISSFF